jgi:hypothetical protein
MGQLALGFRSLLIKVAVFFVMAGLLAWALGGTLFPKPTVVNLPGAGDVYWRVSSGGDLHGLQWALIRDNQEIKTGHWQSVVGPVIVHGESWIATGNAGQWSISKVTDGGIEDVADPPREVVSSLFPSLPTSPK